MYALFLFIEGKVEVIFKNMRHIHGREKRKIQGNRPSGPDITNPNQQPLQICILFCHGWHRTLP